MTHGIFNKKLIAVALTGAFICAGNVYAQERPVDDTQATSALSRLNTVKRWFSSVEDGHTVINFVFEQAAPTNIAHFTGPNGNYIALDFPGVVSTPEAVSASTVSPNGTVSKVRWVDTSKKGRAVIETSPGVTYNLKNNGNILQVILASGSTNAPDRIQTAVAPLIAAPSAVMDLQYKKTDNSNGQFVLDISDPATKVKVARDGNSLVIDVPGAVLPRNLSKRVKLEQLDTPIVGVSPLAREGGTRVVLEGRGSWDYAFTQTGKQIVVDVFKLGDEYKIGGKRIFTGKKLSISFQDVPVRTLLQILAEFTGLNIIATDSVGGNMTLKLNDVPWDQALDIIMQSRGLDSRKSGNVLWVAPKSELIAKDKSDNDEREQLANNAPLISETFQLNYQQASEFLKMIEPKAGQKRGTASVDVRTNQLFVKDTAEHIEEIKKLIKQIDVPVRQVSIEAKIVEVSDSWGRNLGVKFGFNDPTGLGIGKIGNNKLFFGGNIQSAYSATGQSGGTTTAAPNNSLNVSLPAGSINGATAGVFSFSLFNNALTKFLNLEISALEADGKAKMVSTPRVVTADGKDALIEEGKEIPYQQATSSGATSVSFKKAVMSLSVKPKITPDGKVSMELKVNKDSKGETTRSGPAIDTKKVDTTVLVDNGGTIVIGGIIVQEESSQDSKVPLLGDIPVLGNAFKTTSKSTAKREMIIMITPRIIEGAKSAE